MFAQFYTVLWSPYWNETKYSRTDQVKFFKDCLPQILLDPFLNTLSQMWHRITKKYSEALGMFKNKIWKWKPVIVHVVSANSYYIPNLGFINQIRSNIFAYVWVSFIIWYTLWHEAYLCLDLTGNTLKTSLRYISRCCEYIQGESRFKPDKAGLF